MKYPNKLMKAPFYIIDPRKNPPKRFELAKFSVQRRFFQVNRAHLKMNVQRLAGALLVLADPTSGFQSKKRQFCFRWCSFERRLGVF